MIVAITGGTGFIGKKLVRKHLERGDVVRILSRRQSADLDFAQSVNWYEGDLGAETDLRPFVDGADVLYHCAGEIRNVERMEAVHIDGTRRLAEAAAGRIGRWVQLSSVGVYGQPRKGDVTEQSPLCPAGVYETSKKISDDIVEAGGKKGAFQWAILRPSIVFGEDMPNQSLFQMVNVISRGRFFFVGCPGASANYIHADNVIAALIECALLPAAAGQIFNLSDHETMETFVGRITGELGIRKPRLRIPESVVRLLAALGTRLVKGFPLTQSRVDALTNRAVYPIDHIQKELGYKHAVSMEAAIARLVQAWRERTNAGH